MISTIILIILGVLLLTGLTLWLIGERWHPLRRSTWRIMKEAGLRNNLNFSTIHAYLYGRWIKQYIKILLKYIVPRLKPNGKQKLADHYHGKVLTHEHAKAIININRKIPLRDLEQIIPYKTARNLVLDGPPDIVVFECGCRATRDNPCQPTEVCMVIGQPFADFIFDHHPKTSRRLTQTEALDLLKSEHERGHLHSAWFKDVMLDRFYAICNCCGCCCGGIQNMIKYGVPMMASSGYVAQIDKSKCNACSTCVEICPFKAIKMNDTTIVNWDTCMGCGVCVDKCPGEAITLVRDEKKGVPMDVRLMIHEDTVDI
ncbi:ATP-binding protein [Candidatus Latescibacterota bacterium]